MIRVPEGKFWIGKTEVTLAEFEIWYFKKDLQEGSDASSRPSNLYEPHDQGWGGGRRPAIKVTRQSAEQYCAWLSGKTGKKYRLPAEKEWELACGHPEPVADHAWFGSESTQEVATKKPNARGIHDMLGNVWEYTSDDEDGAPVLRGGAWNSETVSPQSRTRYDESWNERDPQRPRSKWWVCDGPFLGFRLARSE